jgi:sodium transport system permease protein
MNRSQLNPLATLWTVFRKELIDAMRDRRTLMLMVGSFIVIGPLMMMFLSASISQLQNKNDRRQIYVQGAEYAPSLNNYFARQGITVKTAPANFEKAIQSESLRDPVIIIHPHFEDELAQGLQPKIEVVYDSSSREASNGGVAQKLLIGFSQERAALTLALRGVSSSAVESLDIQEHDLANAQARASQFMSILPMFTLMAVGIGALNAAIDTTAGERERGSMEPLLMTPGKRWAIVIGKWGAVTMLGILVVCTSCFSFLPSQELMSNETMQAMFQFGWREAAEFILVLIPFTAVVSAMMMVLALYGRTAKEAQAQCGILLMAINLIPVMILLNPGAEAPWQFAVPGVAQSLQMNHILKGESLDAVQLSLPLTVSLILTLLCIWQLARRLRSAAVV